MLALGAIFALVGVLFIVLLASREEIISEVPSQLPLYEALAKIEAATSQFEATLSCESGVFDFGEIIPVEAGCPPGMDRIVAHNIAIAGISRQRLSATEFFAGFKQALIVEREPTNPPDSNAIAVIGTWTERGTFTSRREHLGYVPREVASKVASVTRELEPLAAALKVMSKSTVNTGILAVSFNIWTTKCACVVPKNRRLSTARSELCLSFLECGQSPVD